MRIVGPSGVVRAVIGQALGAGCAPSGRRKSEPLRRRTAGPMLAVPRATYDAVIDHAIEGSPQEVCGVLGGRYGEAESTVRTAERATNAAPAPEYEYAIDPAEQLDVMESLEAQGHEIVGFYHSHPTGPPGPSATDAAQATWPGRSYVIVDLAGDHPFVGAWRWDGDNARFVREALDIE